MANTTRRPRLRPQVYVHVEFGVSWTADQPPRNHEVTYRSRALRERLPPFPRQVPAPNTNYLSNAAPSHGPVPYDWDMYHGYYAPPLPQPELSRDIQRQGGEEPRRSSRSESRSSHERGQSAPPPFGNNPWDVNVPQAQQLAYQTGQGARQPPEVWKALPEVPSRFRLGEDSLPWGAWSVPYGYDPEAHPQDDEYHQPSVSTAAGTSGSNVASATSPTEVSVFSPGPSGPGFRPDDPGRAHELGALGAALMTVDNGFENQWWYQGQREEVTTGDVVGETIQNPQRFSRNSLGWAVASTAASRFDGLSLGTTDVMSSPLHAFASPDSAAGHPPLTRSLSTRSDELFFTERGRNSLPA
ncbi:hypothetical protein CONLIGDRAFT_470594 [Coniochaeta ligniaria NRRL 30616]|uniref:Uncharacterized protein n=1 Tax=Coniochaeta ligniaria NRRL 30616 TaxID=1408157 RepID=A0A1J7JAZ3_9PEZI|nr:hypothetical protein CONLIGDRAFT_470594 [Coniochaeta ligniaria NRRL 30616]